MELARNWVTYQAPAGSVPALQVKPAMVREPLPAVVVIQEAWGLDGHIEDIACRLASAGYVTLAPDLYAIGGNRPELLQPQRIEAVKRFVDVMAPEAWNDMAARAKALEGLAEPERAQVAESMAAAFSPTRDLAILVAALRGAVSHLQADPDVARRGVASLGFCLGGGLSGRLACSPARLAGAVVFYGSPPPPEELASLSCPLLGLYGGADARITNSVPAMVEAVAASGGIMEHHIYPGAPHAFFNDTRPAYRVEAARDAWARVLGFLARVTTVA